MNPNQIQLIQQTFAKIEAVADIATTLFYRHLFNLDPAIKPLFANSNMEVQRDKLMTSLRAVVNALDNPKVIVPELQAMGVRHASYGVADHHYKLVGDALILALKDGIGRDMTPAVTQAWATAYEWIADTMISAAHRAKAAA